MSAPETDRVRGLYAVTDPDLCPGERVLDAGAAALRGGAAMLQYRDKHADTATRRHRAARLALLCQEYGALFIVNDDPALAAEVEADGVHLGQSDGRIDAARQLLGGDKLIGVSCHGRLDLARNAADEGAENFPAGLGRVPVRAAAAVLKQRSAQPLLQLPGRLFNARVTSVR